MTNTTETKKEEKKEMEGYFKTPYVQLEDYNFSKGIVKLIPEEMARNYKAVALELNGHILTVAMATGANVNIIKAVLAKRLNVNVQAIYANEQEIVNALNENYKG